MVTPFQQNVYTALKRIPKGKVITYAAIARAIDKPQAARAVGKALNRNPFKSVPCHRVVRSDGTVGGFARGTRAKIKLLQKEGVRIRGSRVDSEHILTVV